MKFIDEATIRVIAGRGGDGSASFRREKYIPLGGPDGGDGGRGGSIWLQVDTGLNTLADFRHAREFRADSGQPGRGRRMSGRSGKDIVIDVPAGTQVYDQDSGELLGDLTAAGERLCVAQGGAGGLGNCHFKSSTNRAPRQTTPGRPGQERNLRLELKLLADVGLLGLPNAGKSTLISALSAARPRVADYPFTTLSPNLGVVSMEAGRSFVIADIPGIIRGAAAGAGLGLWFLRHLQRTRLLLQLVDLQPPGGADPVQAIEVINRELRDYDAKLAAKPRWLVFTKSDLLPEDGVREQAENLANTAGWQERWFVISSVSGMGLQELQQAVMRFLEQQSCQEA